MSNYDITDDQIKALRAEAQCAGDTEQVRLCDLALGHRDTVDLEPWLGDMDPRRFDSEDAIRHYYSPMSQRLMWGRSLSATEHELAARACRATIAIWAQHRCAEAIAEAQAASQDKVSW